MDWENILKEESEERKIKLVRKLMRQLIKDTRTLSRAYFGQVFPPIDGGGHIGEAIRHLERAESSLRKEQLGK